MSLVRSAELSSYRNPKLYSSEGSENIISDLSLSDNDIITTTTTLCSPSESSGNSSCGPHQNNPSDYLMRLKLRELERALLGDDEDESMEEDSPSSSSSFGSNTKTMKSPSAAPPPLKELLIGCAAAISDGDASSASAMIDDLRQRVSIHGEPSQRIAAYMVEGLAARLAASGKFLYGALRCKEPPNPDRLAAMQILFEVCPCFKFGFMAANGAILEALDGEPRAHIIDFDVNQGTQYMTLVQAMAGRRPPCPVRVTAVVDPGSGSEVGMVGRRLEGLAEELGVELEFRTVEARIGDVTPAMLLASPPGAGALVVNFAFQLHHVPDESVSTSNERDRLLRMVKGMGPKAVTVVEQDVNTNTTPFLSRFVEAYGYYAAVFESLDATLPRDSQDRANVERQCLARDIVNVVACEGEERIERYEVAGKWRARMAMAGFEPRPMSAAVVDSIGDVIRRQYCGRYSISREMGALHFGWEDKNLIIASAWR